MRTAYRWAADQGDLDTAATIATYAGFFGVLVENYEPIIWAEELIEPSRAVDHPRLMSLCAIASQCYMVGRIEEAVGYSDVGQEAMRRSQDDMPVGLELWLAAVYVAIGQPERYVAFCRAQLARGRSNRLLTRTCLVVALTVAGRPEESLAAATGLIDAAEATHNPYVLSYALLAYGIACREEDRLAALDTLRRGLVVAQDSGNRSQESYLAMGLGRIEAEPRDSLAALDEVILAIRNYHDAGNTNQVRTALGILVTFLDRLGHYESAAAIAGFACVTPMTAASIPEIDTAIAHLREVLGDQTYESLAHKGETMTTAAMATYAYDEIEQARQRLRP